jgi:hypothetical protein
MKDYKVEKSNILFRSVQMRLYALHKRQFVAVFAVFFICLFITILIGIIGPRVIQSDNYKPKDPPEEIVNNILFFSKFLSESFFLFSLVHINLNQIILINFINVFG